jgi:transcription termination factor NusB
VAISHEFFSGKEPTLANGVLDRLAWTLRPDELEATKHETTNEEQ